MSEILIYTKTGCPYCAAAKKHYSETGKNFREINITDHPEMKETVLKLTDGVKIVPVIVGDGPEIRKGFGGG
ncbi:MAG: glutaredoxin [Candidatus Zixiibacteriota bacterium]